MVGRRAFLGRGLARRAAAVPDAFPIAPTLTLADVSPRLRKMDDDEMKRKFELPATASVADAVKHLVAQRITFACVVGLDGRVVGMFSERDYLRYAVRADASAFFSGKDATQVRARARTRTRPRTRDFLRGRSSVPCAPGGRSRAAPALGRRSRSRAR